ncbi:protein of unknown function DUF151 [Petrotoga mobilis SJ95]|jgi:hypothetical protein|uniref:BFN domain-containing protein n=1 Tax=Petrotoga mobilis (strain DSM 10674 / SJ95) TaxID=403833 RepID=A9BFE8_PETMO|nr:MULTISPECIES: bifunctional nuclease family protein [Petrotoga]ABX30933.1 protein of unknown function DUF151 [Petrotoga mobilis SJ95]PNR88641.1 hypothetical protein X925_05700 [Petrotoga sp. 9T1HF07.CasAA.8.2]PNR92673.1 hypothetical protein X926_05945 [Petrotoga sp. HWHPT.55.6.3]RLL83367.1 hypothetical protein BZ25_07955 [Petrotoga sp. Shatin.DS.tank11.9.2.9.3]RLL90503.1 hypothetical protein CN13_01025 [Petrotoga sp. HKA.pet.4.5]
MKKVSNVTMGIDKVSNSPIVFLKVEDTNVVVPIWIGPCEAGVLALILRNEDFERPLTHDLIGNIIEQLKAQPIKIEIDQFKQDIYYAKLVLKDSGSKEIYIDARPSDCIILSLKNNLPIYIDEEIVSEHGIEASFINAEEQSEFRQDIENFDIDELRRKFENKNKTEDEDDE